GEESRRALDAAGAGPIAPLLAGGDTGVTPYYRPRPARVGSPPSEEALPAPVPSPHGIPGGPVPDGQSRAPARHHAAPPTRPVLRLRRAGPRVAHRWRLFRTRREALVYMAEYYGKDAEARQWAEALPVADFEELLSRFGSPA